MRLGLVQGIVVLAATALGAGCSGSSSGVVGPGAAPCPGTMSEVARGCPATFSGALEDVACTPYLQLGRYDCEGLTVLIEANGLGGVSCVYDSSTQALVGARLTTDYNAYCGGASFRETAGRVPTAACFDHPPSGVERQCPPLGAADAAVSDAISE